MESIVRYGVYGARNADRQSNTLVNEGSHIDFYEINIVSFADAGIYIHCWHFIPSGKRYKHPPVLDDNELKSGEHFIIFFFLVNTF